MKANNHIKSDALLIEQFSKGDEAAFREIVDKHKDALYTFLYRFLNQKDLIDDVFQETFLQLYISRDSFDTSKPLRPWLFTIAANKAKDTLRKMKRVSHISLGTVGDPDEVSIGDVLNSLACDDFTPEDDVLEQERSVIVRQIVQEMPENLRGILILAYFKQFSYKQMADILSIPIGTVKSRLHTAVNYFTKRWKAINSGGK